MDCESFSNPSRAATGAANSEHSEAAKTDETQAVGPTGPSRRSVLATGAAGIAAAFVATSRKSAADPVPPPPAPHLAADAPVEFIVVGSGAGGGPLACNLARAGHKVVLFEAGGPNDGATAPVPFFSAFTDEDPSIRWDYYVRHYENPVQRARSSQYIPDQDGVWYPRVGSLGGCTLHSFMVDIYPSDSDWNRIARLTGDGSWSAAKMRGVFQRLEQCRYVPPRPLNPSRHGYHGWQPTEMPDPSVYRGDPQLPAILRAAAAEQGDTRFSVAKMLAGTLDPNDWRLRNDREGIYNIPLFTDRGARFGTRQLIQATQAALPNNLIVRTHCLVTKVLFEGRTAVGVEYLKGRHLYRADPNAGSAGEGTRKRMRAAREVILAGGAFNTPQLLKLSGVGPADELAAHGIPLVVDLPGVGENLQDRYEIGMVTDFPADWTFAAACRPGQDGDPCFEQWLGGTGPYTGYGAVGGILRQSETQRRAGRPNADLLISIALTRFKGYFPGYSVQDIAGPGASHQLTWLILKAHTRNRAGSVTLKSGDPLDTPVIKFRYFFEGTDRADEDLSSIVDGLEFSRAINTRLGARTNGDIWPGPAVRTREDLAQWVRDEAWGHHASCSCKIGTDDDPMAVLTSRFRVRGTRGLRVVDASAFPFIPGYFILMPIYMISQKASENIIAFYDGEGAAEEAEAAAL